MGVRDKFTISIKKDEIKNQDEESGDKQHDYWRMWRLDGRKFVGEGRGDIEIDFLPSYGRELKCVLFFLVLDRRWFRKDNRTLIKSVSLNFDDYI